MGQMKLIEKRVNWGFVRKLFTGKHLI